jgi:hypothetical protein
MRRGRMQEGQENNKMEAAKDFDRVFSLKEPETRKGRRRWLLQAACCVQHIRGDSHWYLLNSVH